MKVITSESQKVPIKIWADIEKTEKQSINQLKNIASLPFVFKHVAAMPDVHFGIGATVGSVIATNGAVIPAAVGVDCRKDLGVIDEIPGAYKNIDEVMENQKDLVEVVAQLKQFMCIKG